MALSALELASCIGVQRKPLILILVYLVAFISSFLISHILTVFIFFPSSNVIFMLYLYIFVLILYVLFIPVQHVCPSCRLVVLLE